ncbi:hypothetical protein LSAT2_025335 [Lamellibrachia satsuma]|nr:hypothetical protein LSAT2_025335 [Lamellibrachia satsuma]
MATNSAGLDGGFRIIPFKRLFLKSGIHMLAFAITHPPNYSRGGNLLNALCRYYARYYHHYYSVLRGAAAAALQRGSHRRLRALHTFLAYHYAPGAVSELSGRRNRRFLRRIHTRLPGHSGRGVSPDSMPRSFLITNRRYKCDIGEHRDAVTIKEPPSAEKPSVFAPGMGVMLLCVVSVPTGVCSNRHPCLVPPGPGTGVTYCEQAISIAPARATEEGHINKYRLSTDTCPVKSAPRDKAESCQSVVGPQNTPLLAISNIVMTVLAWLLSCGISRRVRKSV